ncbi:MAG: DNA polymerase III subunit delta' [Elusimicrobia bacterium]|nr:DNA polymerase III subunit delta' [Elusimicrobiota bacterium]MBU2614349.1 DNA polymerase III subunit delta' [Elusimicrobiota bacterium]
MSLPEILGQNKAISLLQKQLSSNKISHAYIFSGLEGTGKRKTALELAKALNCLNQTANSPICDACASCNKINKGIHPDVHLIDYGFQAAFLEEDVEKQTRIKIDTVQEVQKQISMKASEGKWKVFIIDPAEKMNTEAANCLLKTLEEPPENSLLILVSSSHDSLPQTILSRCQHIRFNQLNDDIISGILVNLYSQKASDIAQIVQFSQGSVSKALRYLNSSDEISSLIGFWSALKTNAISTDKLMDFSESLSKDKQMLEDFLVKILILARLELNQNSQKTTEIIEFIIQCKKALRYNVNNSLLSDIILLKLNEIFKLKNEETLCQL